MVERKKFATHPRCVDFTPYCEHWITIGTEDPIDIFPEEDGREHCAWMWSDGWLVRPKFPTLDFSTTYQRPHAFHWAQKRQFRLPSCKEAHPIRGHTLEPTLVISTLEGQPSWRISHRHSISDPGFPPRLGSSGQSWGFSSKIEEIDGEDWTSWRKGTRLPRARHTLQCSPATCLSCGRVEWTDAHVDPRPRWNQGRSDTLESVPNCSHTGGAVAHSHRRASRSIRPPGREYVPSLRQKWLGRITCSETWRPCPPLRSR